MSINQMNLQGSAIEKEDIEETKLRLTNLLKIESMVKRVGKACEVMKHKGLL